jgi:hypothetical protein
MYGVGKRAMYGVGKSQGASTFPITPATWGTWLQRSIQADKNGTLARSLASKNYQDNVHMRSKWGTRDERFHYTGKTEPANRSLRIGYHETQFHKGCRGMTNMYTCANTCTHSEW